jgi:hypothetical protein
LSATSIRTSRSVVPAQGSEQIFADRGSRRRRRPGNDGPVETPAVAERGAVRADPRYQAFMLLRIGPLPIIMGVGK